MSASFLVLLYETAPGEETEQPPLPSLRDTFPPRGEGKGKYPRAACATRARLDSNVKCIV